MTHSPLQWSTEKRRVSDLVEYEYNPRKMTTQQMKKLRESLEKFGLVEIPVINLDGILLAGHQRCKAMIALGRADEVIDVRVPNRQLTELELKEYNISSNAIHGDWVDEILKEHFQEIDLAGFDIQLESLESEHAAAMDEPAKAPEMPIVPRFSEKYTAFIIVTDNEIDENHIAELLQVDQEQCYKSSKIGRTHVLLGKEFIELWKSAKS